MAILVVEQGSNFHLMWKWYEIFKQGDLQELGDWRFETEFCTLETGKVCHVLPLTLWCNWQGEKPPIGKSFSVLWWLFFQKDSGSISINLNPTEFESFLRDVSNPLLKLFLFEVGKANTTTFHVFATIFESTNPGAPPQKRRSHFWAKKISFFT